MVEYDPDSWNISTAEDLLKMAFALPLRAFLVLFSLFVFPLDGQIPKKEKYHAIKEDIPYIKCETCQKAVKYLYGKTQEMRDDGPTKRVSVFSTVDRSNLNFGNAHNLNFPVPYDGRY